MIKITDKVEFKPVEEPDYDEFGEYLNSVTNLSNNYEITLDWSTPAVTNCINDDAYPAEGEFEIEYCGIEERPCFESYILNIKKYYTEFEVDGMPIQGKFMLNDFLKKGCTGYFSFEFSTTDSNIVVYRCGLLDYELQ